MEHREKICSQVLAHAPQRSSGAILDRFVVLDMFGSVMLEIADVCGYIRHYCSYLLVAFVNNISSVFTG